MLLDPQLIVVDAEAAEHDYADSNVDGIGVQNCLSGEMGIFNAVGEPSFGYHSTSMWSLLAFLSFSSELPQIVRSCWNTSRKCMLGLPVWFFLNSSV